MTDAETGRTTTVDLAADFRTEEPDALAIGPVMSEAVERFPNADFERYGVDAARIASVRRSKNEWSRSLIEHPAPSLVEPAVRPRAQARRQRAPESTTTIQERLDRGPGVEL